MIILDNKFIRIYVILTIWLILSACGKGDRDQKNGSQDWNERFLEDLFKKVVIDVDPLLYPEITNLKQLKEASKRIYIPAETFFEANNKIVNFRPKRKQAHILRLTYDVVGQQTYEGYAYVDIKDKKKDKAYLIIPGTGANEASKIFYSNKADYHCCLRNALDKRGDLFVLVKPNNDFLAIHHNGKILDGTVALFPQLLSMGGSYSTRYLVDAIALTKYLNSAYQKVVILGLSQGGSAALFVALQTQPDAAVVSSGYSVLNSGPVYIANIKQIVIPGFLSFYTPEYIRKVIQQQSTLYLFTYGQNEIGMYGYETVEKITENFLKNIDNIHFYYHPNGHVFPVKGIMNFLNNQGL
jgi:predicted esterase